ncbi:uncharacterized protein K02A2.6-like [Malaya genurostris]|uniref:uncharacterized protein K02A2.6-like n=1 Tax=Malaya genurostris TaxID=325434 RepID=UPI0026F3CF1D|nr:uncharacterized protein K02A2.6-like [Malaya genurostris]
MEETEQIIQTVSLFSPASYNLPQFKFSHLPTSEIRNAWNFWLRWFENVMVASNIADGRSRKAQLLAMGGIELQSVFYGIPGADDADLDGEDPYEKAKQKLNEHFSPKQHESFERFQFWLMCLEKDEPIEKFLHRIQQKAEKCVFGTNEQECRQIAIIDKIIQNAPEDLRRKLLEKQQLTLDDVSKMINAYQSIRHQAAQMTNQSKPQVDVHRLIVKKRGLPFYKDSGIPAYKAKCYRCGRLKHPELEKCPAVDKVCHRCQNIGHFQTMCRTNGGREPMRGQKRRYSPTTTGYPCDHRQQRKFVRRVDTHKEYVPKEEKLPIYQISSEDDEYLLCRVGGVEIEMIIDSGSTYNLIDDTTWELLKLKDFKYNSQRFDSSKRFLAYGKVPLKLLAVFDAVLEISDAAEIISSNCTFYVIEDGQQPLLGRLTARKLGLLRIGLPSMLREDINHVAGPKTFPKIKDFKLVLPIDRSVPPVIQPLRRCPVPILNQMKAKLEELLEMNIIERVTKPTSWVSPLVPIIKDNGELRLCVDMRRANEAIQRLNHPLPVFEDLLARFSGAKYFTTLDIKQAFHQVELSEESRDITTFITNWGLFRYTRLLFGVNYAPEFFQNLMESILSECNNTVVFIDDIVIWGVTEKEHDESVKKTLSVIASYGISLNVQKYLATLSHPLRELLKGYNQFEWLPEHEQSFEALKRQIGRVDYLGYFDPKDNTILEDSEVYIRRTAANVLATLSPELPAIDISEIIEATANDEEMQAVKSSILEEDWSSNLAKQYSAFRSELSFANGLIMRGSKLVVPMNLRNRMLMLAHEGHPGQSCMKRRLRERCWWPNMDNEIIKVCEKCEGCRLVQIPDPPEPMQRRPLPDKPWIDIAIDFLGPLPSGEYILVVIDYFSRHVDIEVMTVITAKETIKRLCKIFGLWGVPRTITLDNAKQFVAGEFHDFCKLKGIHLNHTSPYWPQANGEVERQNRSLLKRLKIANALYGDWKAGMEQYLEMYNNTPHSTTGKSPNELLQNRRLRFKLPNLEDLATAVPSTEHGDKDATRKFLGKEREDAKRRSKSSSISVGDVVLMRNLHPTNKLSTNFLQEKYLVVERNGANARVRSADTGKTYDRNVSHLKKIPGTLLLDTKEEINDPTEKPSETAMPRRSVRTRKPPVRFD